LSGTYNLRKFVAPEIIFGNGCRHFVGKYAQQLMAQRVLLVSDAGVAQTPWLQDVTNSLEEVGIAYEVFTGVSPNPRHTEVIAGAKVYLEHDCDVIVAVGGGSPMDCAKGIGIISSNQQNILDFEGVDKIYLPVPPLIFVPTTAGSSADVSQFCILSNQIEKKKIAIVSKAIVPDVALIDPETTTSMDSYLTACVGVDALTHAIEAYVSTGSGVLTDASALEAIRLVREYLIPVLANPADLALREKIMLASMKAGLAFSNASLGAVHAMAHGLGGLLDLPHGECNAMLLDHVVAFNYASAPDKFRIIAETFGLDVRGMRSLDIQKKLLSEIALFKQQVGIAKQLKARGVNVSDVPDLTDKALRDACMLTNPRHANNRDIEVIFEEAM